MLKLLDIILYIFLYCDYVFPINICLISVTLKLIRLKPYEVLGLNNYTNTNSINKSPITPYSKLCRTLLLLVRY